MATCCCPRLRITVLEFIQPAQVELIGGLYLANTNLQEQFHSTAIVRVSLPFPLKNGKQFAIVKNLERRAYL